MARDYTALTNTAAARAARTAARYSSERYTPVGLEQLSNAEISRELSRARDILRKRASRAGEFYTEEQAARIQELLQPVRDIPVSDRPEVLSEIARELSGGTSSRAEAREALEEAVEDFQSAGYDYIDSSNVREFLDFASEFTSQEKNKAYGSGTLLNYFEHQKERIARGDAVKISRLSFMRWLREREG